MFANPHRLVVVWRFATWLAALEAKRQADALEAAIAEEAAAQGIAARVEVVRAVMPGPEFQAAFRAVLDASRGTVREPTDEETVRTLALDTLAGLGVSTDDVLVTVFWAPPSLQFTVHGMTPEARARCIEAIGARGAGEAKDAA